MPDSSFARVSRARASLTPRIVAPAQTAGGPRPATDPAWCSAGREEPHDCVLSPAPVAATSGAPSGRSHPNDSNEMSLPACGNSTRSPRGTTARIRSPRSRWPCWGLPPSATTRRGNPRWQSPAPRSTAPRGPNPPTRPHLRSMSPPHPELSGQQLLSSGILGRSNVRTRLASHPRPATSARA